MTPETEQRLIILEPEGPQGPKLGLEINDQEQYKALDEAVGTLDPNERHDLSAIAKVAKQVGVRIVKP